MAESLPQFESKDDLGTTQQFTGSVGTSNASIPAVAGNAISEVLIRNPTSNLITKNLLFSFDGGTTFQSLSTGEAIIWTMKGRPTQIIIKGSAAATNYEVILNREP